METYSIRQLCPLFQNSSPMKKIRKSLERKWSTPGDIALFGQGDGLGMIPETPVSHIRVIKIHQSTIKRFEWSFYALSTSKAIFRREYTVI